LKITAEKERKVRIGSTACNEHIAKIAALPRVDNFCVFLQPLLALIKCWEAATSAICRNVVSNSRAANPHWKSLAES
jgi:hypothetical protein